MTKKLSKPTIAFILITLCLFSISRVGECKEFADGKRDYNKENEAVWLGSIAFFSGTIRRL